MNDRAALDAAVARAGTAPIAEVYDLSGGCIHTVRRLTLDDGNALVAKITSAGDLGLFEEESASLDALAASGAVLVPRPLLTGAFGSRAILLMSCIEPGRADGTAWARFGEELAALHDADAGARYGFATDNHLGTTPQPNGWCDDWVTFNAEHRFGHQLRLARDARRLGPGEAQRVASVIDRLDRLIPRRPHPALLHGDLWSGNALPAANGRIAVIDPACSVGDGWADIAMMRLFGGFSSSCFEAYASARDDANDIETRVAVYQLYHVLNHVNIFGSGYVGQAMSLCGRLA